jgi:O-antigen ligase
MIDKQWKLLVMLAVFCSVTGRVRRMVVYAFIAGVTVSMLMTYLTWFDIFQYGGSTVDRPARGGNVIYYNVLLAFAFYLVCNRLLQRGIGSVSKMAWVCLSILMAVNMFIVGGRAGQVVFFVLCGLLIVQVFRKNILRAGLIIIVILPAIFFGAYKLSPLFQERVDQVPREIAQFYDNPVTSTGLRLLFWKNSWEMIKENPWIGVGTGDFKNEYEKINQVFSPAVPLTDNPHNQYVFALSKFGLLGLLVLLSLFATQLYEAVRIKDEWQQVRVAFPVFFLTIMLTESYLIVYETGFLYAIFSAVLFKRTDADIEYGMT